MRHGRRWATTVASAATAAAVAVTVAISGTAPASAASTSPFDPPASTTLNGATQGTISFYDASGKLLTHGPLATPPAFALADTDAGRAGDTLATLFAVTPSSTAPSYTWANMQISASDAYPATLPGALAGSTHAAVSSTFLWFDPSSGYPNYYPNNDANAAWQGLYQLRMYTSGPGQPIDTTRYSSATVAVDQVAGEWTQIYPTPSVTATDTSVTSPTPSVASPAAAGTAITLTSVASAGADHPAGTIQFKDGGTDLGSAVAVDGSGSATSASFTPASGSHSFTAVFTPTDTTTYNGSTSSATSFSVDAVPVDDTATTLTPATGAFADVTAPLTLTATVVDTSVPGPVNGGSVAFKDGSTTVATVPVTAGSAATQIAANTLSLGSHSFTAAYLPSSAYHASSSAASVVTVYTTTVPTVPTMPAPANLIVPSVGAARVGVADTCNPGAWYYAGSYSYAWYLDSSATPFAYGRTTGRLPAAWRGHTVSCRVTATNTGNSPVTAVSGRVTVLPGAAVRATTRPRIVGTVRVGRTVKAYAGVWTATPVKATSSSCLYVWKVGSTVVSRSAAYKIPATYRGRALVLYVYAVRGGFATGVSSSVAVRIG